MSDSSSEHLTCSDSEGFEGERTTRINDEKVLPPNRRSDMLAVLVKQKQRERASMPAWWRSRRPARAWE